MFKVDDYIMYGMTGVCKVIDITNEKVVNGEKRDYYVLSPIHHDNTIIKIPLDNNKKVFVDLEESHVDKDALFMMFINLEKQYANNP